MVSIKWIINFCNIICVVQCVKEVYYDQQKGPGYFENFARDVLFTLSTGFVKERTLQGFLRSVADELQKLDYKYTRKLAKVIRHIAKERDEIAENLQEYVDALNEKGPKIKEFLQAMDKVYTPLHSMRFNSYILELQDYGRESIPEVNQETKKILRDVIIGGIRERPQYVQKELHDKLKRAIKEVP